MTGLPSRIEDRDSAVGVQAPPSCLSGKCISCPCKARKRPFPPEISPRVLVLLGFGALRGFVFGRLGCFWSTGRPTFLAGLYRLEGVALEVLGLRVSTLGLRPQEFYCESNPHGFMARCLHGFFHAGPHWDSVFGGSTGRLYQIRLKI